MNIFVLSADPHDIARHYCEIHLRKMMVEYVQLLSNALPEHLVTYKRTHYNHPCSKWARESAANWEWLNSLVWSMGWEYFNRFSKRHKSCEERAKLTRINIYDYLPHKELTPWPQVMPDEFKPKSTCITFMMEGKEYKDTWNKLDIVDSYRRYYAAKLRDFRKRGLI